MNINASWPYGTKGCPTRATPAQWLGPGRDPAGYDVPLQPVNLMRVRERSDAGMACFVTMVGALINKPVQESLVVLGHASSRGGLQPVELLTERLQLAVDNCARRVLLPLESIRDLLDIPDDVLNRLHIILYSDPANAAFRAMGLE